ncbi:MFS transporter [Candidatus Woesearchaeota archaeon]|nr:MFS transporter [Candidatus Woesearchaeota archaeon]
MKKQELIKKTLDEEHLKEQARNISIEEGSAYSVMDGFGLRYMTPFALSIGANNAQIGILTTLPTLLGSVSELLSVDLMKIRKRKDIVIFGVIFQSLMWLAMLAIAASFFIFKINHGLAPALTIIVFSLLIGAGLSVNPVWMSWMKDIVPVNYGQYLGTRNRITGIVALAATLAAGFILDYFEKIEIFYGFAILFSIAFLGRLYSAVLFKKQYEPEYIEPKRKKEGFFHFLKTVWRTNYGHFAVFISLLSFAANIATPYFAVYMLTFLNYSKIEFGMVIIAAAISSIIFMPMWGRFEDAYGTKKTMKVTGIFTSAVALLWFASYYVFIYNPSLIFPYTICLEFFSGFIWSGFNLAATNFIFDAVKREKVASKTAYFHILNNFGGFAGAITGGIIASLSIFIWGIAAILFVMLLSFAGRLLVYLLLIGKVKETRHHLKKFTIHEAKEKLLSLTPLSIFRILR